MIKYELNSLKNQI